MLLLNQKMVYCSLLKLKILMNKIKKMMKMKQKMNNKNRKMKINKNKIITK